MGTSYFVKVYLASSIVITLGLMTVAENKIQDRSKYKYGYVISHKGGSTQAHLESRDGNLALGRYYVNLHNGTGQKVTYFADDLGFHTGVSYSSQNGQGSSKTQIAMGQKALAAFGDSEVQQNSPVTVSSPTLLFGKKIQKAALSAVTPQPEVVPKLNYTPVPGGFYLTHESVEQSNSTTEHPSYIASLTSQTFSSYEGKYSGGVPQSKANTQTFYPTSENVKNEIKELHIQPTTPSIKSYTSVPQHGSIFPGVQDEAAQFSQNDQTVKVSASTTNLDDLSYTKQKSIEKTNFADIDAQIISEVQKHAEQIIMKDLQKSHNLNLQNDFARFSSSTFQPSTVTMKPIVVTNDGETGFNYIISTTEIPKVRKLSKNLQSGTINSVKITEKNSDQTLEDSGYFRVSLSPSLDSSINVSRTPHQSINVGSTDLNSVSNNSTLCEFNLCEKDSKQIFSIDLNPKKEIEESSSSASDISAGSGTNEIVQTFYPENKLHDEKHYITTIDVQKAISFDVNQHEAGNIHLAQNFPFNKIKPFDQLQNQYNEKPKPQPLISNQISVTPSLFAPETSLNFISSPQKSYIINTVTAAPELYDVTSSQNLGMLQGLNDVSSSQIQYGPVVQDRIESNRLGYENQLVVPPPPVVLTNEAADEFRKKQEDLKQVEKNIEELRQQILSNIDAQHEEEQRKQNLVDEERKQYFENLKKVEILKDQNSLSYNVEVNAQSSIIQSTPTPVSSAENVNNVELIPQSQYIPQHNQYEGASQARYEPEPQTQYNQAPQNHYNPTQQPQYETPQQAHFIPPTQTFQTEIKDFTHEVAVPQPSIQQISGVDVYQKQITSYPSQDNAPRQYNVYDTQNIYGIDNNVQQSAPAQTTEKIQLANYLQEIAPIAFRSHLAVPQMTQTKESKKLHQFPVLNTQLNTMAITLGSEVIPQTRIPEGKTLLVNRVVPFDYSRFLHTKQPLSLVQTYSLPLPSETKISELYSQQVPLSIQIPQTYKLITYPEIPVTHKQYHHTTLTQKPTNKLRVQPLKPSTPDDSGQREAVQNLLSQPQFHPTFYYTGLPFNNRLQLRHIRKNQILNSDQILSQSVRRGKSLKNLRIEYGFKPPLRPSVEFSEEVKPSIYGPSVPPQ